MRIPQHLAIIMDGNGRWAEKRNFPRIAGHRQGAQTVQTVVNEAHRLGIKYLTLYAFSSENWGRPGDEVQALMGLLGRYLHSELEGMLHQNIRLNVVGEISRLPSDVADLLNETISRTAVNDGLVLTLALSYGGRDEILRAVRQLASEAASGLLAPEEIDESLFSARLDTKDLPDPDFLIRTSGELRISNFLLWQLAYTELHFVDTLWPDFTVETLHRALEEFARRKRRFGLTGSQIDEDQESFEEKSH